MATTKKRTSTQGSGTKMPPSRMTSVEQAIFDRKREGHLNKRPGGLGGYKRPAPSGVPSGLGPRPSLAPATSASGSQHQAIIGQGQAYYDKANAQGGRAGQVQSEAVLGGANPTGVFAANDPGTIKRFGGAMAGPEYSPIFASITGGGMGGDQTFQTGMNVNPRVTSQDVFAQMLEDRKAEMAAAGDQRGREEQGFGMVQDTLGRTTGGMRDRAGAIPERTEAILGQSYEGARGNLDTLWGGAGQISKGAGERSDENIADVDQRMDEAMGAYQDQTAQMMQSRRLGERGALDSQIQNIKAQASQQGLDPNGPEVQAQVQKAQMASMDRIGQMAVQAGVEVNNAQASLRQSYDQMAVSVRQQEAGRVGQAETAGFQAQATTYQMEDQLRNVFKTERLAAEQQREQLMLLADQAELGGDQWLAGFLREETTYTSPLAPLLMSALAMQESETGFNAIQGGEANADSGWLPPSV